MGNNCLPFVGEGIIPKEPGANEIAARQFRDENPDIWDMFVHLSCEAASVRKRYSSRTVWERMRWHYDFGTNGGDAFRLNNNHLPYWARWFMEDHGKPGFFETRCGADGGARGEEE